MTETNGTVDSHNTGGYLQSSNAGENLQVTVYKRRWYILVLFGLLTGTQGGIWNTWGPLSTSAELAFDWDTSVIALQTNWGPIAYIISIVFFTWLIDVKGLRWACLVTVGCVLIGAALRCITSTPPAATWLIHVGQFMNGLAGPVAMGGPPALSAVWFPVEQRIRATTIGSICNGIGTGLTFIIGPLLVPSKFNTTEQKCNASECWVIHNSSLVTAEERDLVRHDIMRLMYITLGWCAALFVAFLVYFPAKPPSPPSITASIERIDYKSGLIQLFRHKRFWILSVSYAVSTGVAYAWASVITVNLKPFGVDEDEAGWIGFYASFAGNFSSLIISLFADIFKRSLKRFILVLYLLSTVFYVLFALTCINIIPFSSLSITLIDVVGTITLTGAVPLLYEFVCETTYPIAEGLTNGVMTWLNNCVALIFYLVLMLPVSTAWMNWAVIGSSAVCIPIFALYREQYKRLDVDVQKENTVPDETSRLLNPSETHNSIQGIS